MNQWHNSSLKIVLVVLFFAQLLIFNGCAHNPQDRQQAAVKAENIRLVNRALALFDPKNPQYNPDRAKNYLERVLRKGQLTSLDLPAPVILALLRSEKDANKKRKAIERRISSIKRIDLDKDEEVK